MPVDITPGLQVDSQLPFGYCALTLCPVVEPVVTPSGHMYSREAIFEYLLAKTQELKRQQARYDAQEAAAESLRAADADAAAGAAVNQFVSSQLVLHASAGAAAGSAPASSSASSYSSALTVGAGAAASGAHGDAAGRKRKAAAADDAALQAQQQATTVAKLHQEVSLIRKVESQEEGCAVETRRWSLLRIRVSPPFFLIP